MPKTEKDLKFPTILEYIPYRKRDGTQARDTLTYPYISARGYVCLRVDIRGNGESEGLLFDEYTERELKDAEEIIRWVGDQSWSNGKVGMMGISWGGFNSLQVAARNPEPLKAIITLCSTVDRYADDIHYKGGCLLNENLGWGATMLAYSSRPPDPAIVGEKWKNIWMERLKALPHLSPTWLKHQKRDEYWEHGSVCEDYSKIKAAVLAVGGWGDAYKNAVPALVENIGAKGIIGPWVHKYPHFAVPGPQIGFLQEALKWWDKWLKGIDNGVDKDPAYRVYIMEGELPKTSYKNRSGYWVKEDNWPSNTIRKGVYFLNTSNRLTHKEEHPSLLGCVNSPQHCGMKGGEYCAIWLGPELPGDQRTDDELSLNFETEALDLNEDIMGSPELSLTVSADSPNSQLAVRLCDVFPNGESYRITYGILNLRFRDNFKEPADLPVNQKVEVTIKLDHIAYKVPKGNKIRISISNSYWPLVWPTRNPAKVKIFEGKLSIPFRKESASDEWVFPVAESSEPWKNKEIRKSSNTRNIIKNEQTGTVTLEIVDDFGSYQDLSHGLIIGSKARETWSINPNDPLSASGKTHWTEERARDDWSIRTETLTEMTSDNNFYYLEAVIKAYEDKKLIFEKKLVEKIERVL
jgi:hypothetical protein